MATRKHRGQSVEWLIQQIDAQLEAFGRDRHGLTLREKVLALAEVYGHVKDLGVITLHEHGISVRAARERIRLYFLEYVGVVIKGIELAVVSGISDYPRRIRELRVESGYQIASGASPDAEVDINLKPDEYILVDANPDLDAARRWHVANRIRRDGRIGSQKKVLAFLLENVGKVVTTEELAYVANDKKQYARRTRELRTEDGYSVATMHTGRPDLKMGQYVLQSAERISEPHDRRIPQEVEKAVYARDNNTCRICGWNQTRWIAQDPRILELHHLEHHEHGGANVERNLAVLCNKCHDDVHAGRHGDVIERLKASL